MTDERENIIDDNTSAEKNSDDNSYTVDMDSLRGSLALDYEAMYPSLFESVYRTRKNYSEIADENFLNADEKTLQTEWFPKYKDSLQLEMIGALVATAIRTQLDILHEQGKNYEGIEIAEDLFKGSLFGQAFDASIDDIKRLLSDVFIQTEMEDTQKKIIKAEARKVPLEKLSFEAQHFANVDQEQWQEFLPYMKEATFMTRNDLIRLVMYRETKFKLHHKEEIPALIEYLQKNNLPNKANSFRIGFNNLLNEIKEKSSNPNKGAWFLFEEVRNVNEECGESLIEISKLRISKFISKTKGKGKE